jgi:hypothetical protein
MVVAILGSSSCTVGYPSSDLVTMAADRVLGGVASTSDDDFLESMGVHADEYCKHEEADEVPAGQPDPSAISRAPSSSTHAQPITPGRLLGVATAAAGSLTETEADAPPAFQVITAAAGSGLTAAGSDADGSPPLILADDHPDKLAIVTYFPKQAALEPRCQKCGELCDPFSSRLVQKVAHKYAYKCKACCCKHVQLCGIFGGWPCPEFNDMGEDMQMKFWAEKATTKGELEKLVLDHIVRDYIERKTTSDQGDYLPLGVYKTRGFDTDLILANCTDTKLFPALGLCYKVRIQGDNVETIDQMARQKMAEMKQRGDLKRKSSGGRSGSRDRSRRRRSSSSSPPKEEEAAAVVTAVSAKKLAKQEKDRVAAERKVAKDAYLAEEKEKRDAEIAAKAAAKAAGKEAMLAVKATKAELSKVIGRVQGPINAIANVINDPVAEFVQSQAKEEATASLAELRKIFSDCSERLAQRSPEPGAHTVATVSDLIVSASAKCKLMHTFLANERKKRSIPAPK